MGTVTIASPTYTFARTIDHRSNGYLANSYEWFDELQEVIESIDQLESLSKRTRDHVREKYGWFNQWKCIEEALLDTHESESVMQRPTSMPVAKRAQGGKVQTNGEGAD